LSTEHRSLLHDYADWMHSKGYSQRTIGDYCGDTLRHLSWLVLQGVPDCTRASVRDVEAWQIELSTRERRGRTLSPSSVRKYMEAVRCFYGFLYHTGRSSSDPTAMLVLPRRGKSLPRGVLEVAEMEALLDAPDIDTPLGLRDRAMMELLYGTGLRSSELRGLLLENLDVKTGSMRIMGKGGKEALLPIAKRCCALLEDYLLFARPKLLRGRKSGPRGNKASMEKAGRLVFISANARPITTGNLGDILRRHARAAGIDKWVIPHGIRHTCATHLLRGGADIRMIQRLLRHEDLGTTQIYTKVEVSDLKEAQRKFHPREQLGFGLDDETLN
jgi:integrase/recombinase XerD